MKDNAIRVFIWIVVGLSVAAIGVGVWQGINAKSRCFDWGLFSRWLLPALGALAMAFTGLLIYKQFKEQRKANLYRYLPYISSEYMFGGLYCKGRGVYQYDWLVNGRLHPFTNEQQRTGYTTRILKTGRDNNGEDYGITISQLDKHMLSVECWHRFVNKTTNNGKVKYAVLYHLYKNGKYITYKLKKVGEHETLRLDQYLDVYPREVFGGHYNFPNNYENAPKDIINNIIINKSWINSQQHILVVNFLALYDTPWFDFVEDKNPQYTSDMFYFDFNKGRCDFQPMKNIPKELQDKVNMLISENTGGK
jgi:hypothetical protein